MVTTPPKLSGQAYHSEENKTGTRSGSALSWNRSPSSRRIVTPEHEKTRGSQSPTSLRKAVNGKHSFYGINVTPPRSSTPIRRGQGSSELGHSPLNGSTLVRRYSSSLPTPHSFHATQSGATISTIKSASTIAFENVLASCEPPLLHISNALANLGIRNEEHLRAIARLSEETRDKELKEEVLKQGITVMEWAILLDRLQKL